jgi:hypothetical protein
VAYQECGADGLRHMFDGMVAGIFDDIDGQVLTVSRDNQERDAEERMAIGLPQVAAMVTKAAEKVIPAHILDGPFDSADTYNFNTWHRDRSVTRNRTRPLRAISKRHHRAVRLRCKSDRS